MRTDDHSFPHRPLFRLRAELRPSEQTPTRRTSPWAVGAARAAWRRTQAAAWTHRKTRVVTPSEPPNPGSANTARHWCSSQTTRTPTRWVISPFLLASSHRWDLSPSWQHLSPLVFLDSFLSLWLSSFLSLWRSVDNPKTVFFPPLSCLTQYLGYFGSQWILTLRPTTASPASPPIISPNAPVMSIGCSINRLNLPSLFLTHCK